MLIWPEALPRVTPQEKPLDITLLPKGLPGVLVLPLSPDQTQEESDLFLSLHHSSVPRAAQGF